MFSLFYARQKASTELFSRPNSKVVLAHRCVLWIIPVPSTSTIMASKKGKKGATAKKRAQRATSNVFAMFDQSQIQEFKEAFNMIDQNRDGFIDVADLKDMFASLGKEPKEDYIEGMVKEATGPINFTMFLTLYGEKLNGTDPEDVIRNAFACFDEEGSGVIPELKLKELMMTMGDRFVYLISITTYSNQ